MTYEWYNITSCGVPSHLISIGSLYRDRVKERAGRVREKDVALNVYLLPPPAAKKPWLLT